ncbi:MAG: AAC(3) family N-acetyltransferase [Fimbriimonas sp.]
MVRHRQLADDLRSLGITPGTSLLVHSSLSSLGQVEGGAATVVNALLDAVGPTGNLMFPTLTGQAHHSLERPPEFDSRNSPAWTGAIPEAARRAPGALRSLHPTHSVVCFGPDSKWLTKGHLRSESPCDRQSPYGRLADIGGRILFIGVGLQANTSFHHLEELAEVPYVLQEGKVAATLLDEKGRELSWKGRLHEWGYPRCYPLFEDELATNHILHRGVVAQAHCLLVNAGAQRAYLLPRLLRDPNLFLAKED